MKPEENTHVDGSNGTMPSGASILIDTPGFTVTRINNPIQYNITWSNRVIPLADIKQVGGLVNRTSEYGMVSRKTINALRTRTSLTQHQIISARNALLKNKIMSGYNRMNAIVPRIMEEYERDGVMVLSARYDFPPLNLIRGILLRKQYSASSLHRIFVQKLNAAEVLQPYDMQQYMIAEQNDAESLFNQRNVALIAAANELIFVNFFRSLGIALKDENEIAAEQIAEHGRAIATPDILFLDTVVINGEHVGWLDYKDYIGTNVRFLYMSNVKQAHEYEKRWGAGAICYHHGFIAGMHIPGAMLLDAHALLIKLQNKDDTKGISGINGKKRQENRTQKVQKV